jgi:hypothetical protein
MKYIINDFIKKEKFSNIQINNNQILEIQKILEVYTKKELKYYIDTIFNFIKYDVEYADLSWLDRILTIKNNLFRDSSSLYSYQIRYGNEYGEKLFNEKNQNTKQTVDMYISKYGEIEGRNRWKSKYSLNGHSKIKYIKKYGNIEGEKLFNEYVDKRSDTYRKNKLNGRVYDNGISLKSYIEKYGDEIGIIKHKERFSWCKYRYSKDYYIEKYGDDKGNDMWKEYLKSMSKTSLNSFIERYGEIEGRNKYEIFVKKIAYTNSLECYINKYGDVEGKIKWDEYTKKTIFKKSKFSKISQKLFWSLYDLLPDDLKVLCYFAEYNSEYFIRGENSIIFLDFKVGNAVIEFDGTYWHQTETAKNRDELKNNIILNKGFRLLRIPENDYICGSDDIMDKCLKFILENYE